MKIIVDTDGGKSDIEALFMLLSAKDIEIVAITICAGYATADKAFETITRVLEYIGVTDIPVYKGSNLNFAGELIDAKNFGGTDGIYEASLPETKLSWEQTLTASEALCSYAEKHPNEITLVCIGPLTNLAQAFYNDRTIDTKFNKIVAKGGNSARKASHSVTEYAEFNAYCDPKAFMLVLNEYKPSKGFFLIDWSLCVKYPINKNALAASFGDITSTDDRKSQILDMIKSTPQYVDMHGENEFFVGDQLVAYILLSRVSALKHINVNLKSVVAEGPEKGRTEFTMERSGKINVITTLDIYSFIRILQKSCC